MNNGRFDRQIRLFGKEGQAKIRACNVVVVGVGGIGTHVVQQLALLGIGKLTLIDAEEADESNRNRYIGLKHEDPVSGMRKVDLGERIASEIDPEIEIVKIFNTVICEPAFDAIIETDYVFGCVDRDGVRLIINELSSAYSRPYIDLATEIIAGKSITYGGHACVNLRGKGCLVCLDLIDTAAAGRDLAGPKIEATEEALYGVNGQYLGSTGPSVVSLNGLIASLGVTEFMVSATQLREPIRLAKYYGTAGKVVVSVDTPQSDCYYCRSIRGAREAADVKRYIREGIGSFLR